MKCTICKVGKLEVIDSRLNPERPQEVVRRRKCKDCGAKMDSIEIVTSVHNTSVSNSLPIRSTADKLSKLAAKKAEKTKLDRRARVITNIQFQASSLSRWCEYNKDKFDFNSTKALMGLINNLQHDLVDIARLEE